GSSKEPEAIGQRFEDAFRENQPAFFGPRLEDFEDQLLLARAVPSRHVELVGDVRERADAHVLERREIDALYFFWGRRSVPFGGMLRLRLRGLMLLRWLARLSISFHSSSNPSPVTAETGSTESSNTDSSSLSARIRWPRASLSIFVPTSAARSVARCSHCHAARSLSRPGCLTSTKRSALKSAGAA